MFVSQPGCRQARVPEAAGGQVTQVRRTACRKSGSVKCSRKGPTPLWNACTQQVRPRFGGMQEASARQKESKEDPGALRAHLSKDVEGGQEEHQPNVGERHSHQRHFAWGVHLVGEQPAPLLPPPLQHQLKQNQTSLERQDAHLLAARALGFVQATAGASGADHQQRAARESEPDASLPPKRTRRCEAVPG